MPKFYYSGDSTYCEQNPGYDGISKGKNCNPSKDYTWYLHSDLNYLIGFTERSVLATSMIDTGKEWYRWVHESMI